MTAFFIATVALKDPEKFKQYAQKAGETIMAHGGKPVLRGVTEDELAGHNAVGIVSFPDKNSLNRWLNSPEYQAIIPLRDEAADVTITAYSVPE